MSYGSNGILAGEIECAEPALCRRPSPVRRLATFAGSELWIKNDGELSPVYGGNKLRKLERVLPLVVARGRRRVLTFGAAGSHHALATTIHARRFGLRAAAVLTPQAWSAHAEATLRAALAQGLTVYPAANALDALERLPHIVMPDDHLLPPGALGSLGSASFVSAVSELVAQIQAGELPEPDLIVVAAGTGSTAAGLLAGLALHQLRSRLGAVAVAPVPGLRASVLAQSWWTLARRLGRPVRPSALAERFHVIYDEIGPGYGRPTSMTAMATSIAAELSLTLDTTYTARAFAQALQAAGHPQLARGPACGRVLYWHTLSSAPMTPLLTPTPDANPEPWYEHLLVRHDDPSRPEARW